jgi:hypothetical protein
MSEINSENAVNYILQNIPEYNLSWKHHSENLGADNTIGLTMIDFLHFTITQIEERNLQILPRIFYLIEELMKSKDEELTTITATIFLEGLINNSSHGPDIVPYSVYIPLLGPESRDFCRELDRFWGSQTPGLWDRDVKFVPYKR